MHPLLEPILALHRRIRADVGASCERAAVAALSDVAHDDEGDTIYAIDRVAEDVLVGEIERTIASGTPVRLVAEGLPGGELLLPRDAKPSDVEWVVIVDPIDGTRGLMYQKRPGWILTGVASPPPPRAAAGPPPTPAPPGPHERAAHRCRRACRPACRVSRARRTRHPRGRRASHQSRGVRRRRYGAGRRGERAARHGATGAPGIRRGPRQRRVRSTRRDGRHGAAGSGRVRRAGRSGVHAARSHRRARR